MAVTYPKPEPIPAPPVPPPASPRWGPTVKLIVGLTFVGIFVFLVFNFRNLVGPLLLAFMLTYLLQPVAAWISKVTRLSWGAGVNILFLILILLLLGSLTASSVAIVQQVSNLITFVRDFIQTDLPGVITDLSTRTFRILTFEIDMRNYNIATVGEQVLTYLRPIVSNIGGLVSSFATSAASTTGWALFVLVISYFLLSGANQISQELIHIEIPGYNSDLRRIGRELQRIWNAFLRGQLIMFVLTFISYEVLLTILGVRFSLGIALLAGFARFVPYLGPLTVWITLGLVAFLQGGNHFGLQPWQFTLLAILSGLLVDQIFDNIISPRFFGDTLGVHPAGVLVAAIIAAKLMGFIGLIVAAPVLATLALISGYAGRKMFDMDPWPMTEEDEIKARHKPISKPLRRLQGWIGIVRKRFYRKID